MSGGRARWPSVALAIALATGTGVVAAAPASAAPAPQPVVTATQIVPLAPAVPVLGADGRQHLAYELEVVNLYSKVLTFDSVQVLDPSHDDAVVTTLDASTIAKTLHLGSGDFSAVMPAGASGVLFMDVTLAKDAAVPHSLKHRIHYTLSDAAPPPDPPGVSDTDKAAPLSQDFVGVPEQVSTQEAVVVAPPLEGDHWIVGNGCCAEITAHRGATLPIDGTIHVPERFAIDFVQLDNQGRLFNGPLADNKSYPYFGDKILSVAPGKVVATQDGLNEQTPGSLPSGITLQQAGGNYVVVDIGHSRFALYAHLQPGSLKVKKGAHVKTGQVLGLLGNSGNTDGAHLHFHIMDGPDPLLSNGLPFEFKSFTGEGRVTNSINDVQQGDVAQLNNTDKGAHHDQLPLNLEVIGFPTHPGS
jgi:Peptidase family M23